MTDLFPGSSYATTTEANRIYINENLTSYRRRIRRQMRNVEMASYVVFGHLTVLFLLKLHQLVGQSRLVISKI